MCRWLAYSGSPVLLADLLFAPENSLVVQSMHSRLGVEAVNGDGFGVGWYPTGAVAGSIPATFHSTEPAWNDENLRELTRAVESPLFFSHVRAAAGPPIQRTNCHPFRYENWLFMHNGFLSGFAKSKRDLTFAIDPSLYPSVLGTTDSEVLFHLALTYGLHDDPVKGMTAAIDKVEEVGRANGVQFPMQGTMAVSDGATIWAIRYSTQGRSRTLFHSVDIPTIREMYPDVERVAQFGDHAHVVVSEPLNDLPGVFLEVPESTVAILDPDGYHHEPFRSA